MKLVIRITARVLNNREQILKCARAVLSLVQEGRQVALLHGDYTGGSEEQMARIGLENQRLAAGLARFGVPALRLSGSDADFCRLRKTFSARPDRGIEAAYIDPRWLQVICDNGGVPVISNLVLARWGEHYLLDTDQMAIVCASSWKADALVYLTGVDGIRGENGAPMRWFDLNDIESLQAQHLVAGDMLLKLKKCREALKNGVGRVRILPADKADALESFFSSRNEYGTELFIGQDLQAPIESHSSLAVHASQDGLEQFSNPTNKFTQG